MSAVMSADDLGDGRLIQVLQSNEGPAASDGVIRLSSREMH